jgi:hypothetical protein
MSVSRGRSSKDTSVFATPHRDGRSQPLRNAVKGSKVKRSQIKRTRDGSRVSPCYLAAATGLADSAMNHWNAAVTNCLVERRESESYVFVSASAITGRYLRTCSRSLSFSFSESSAKGVASCRSHCFTRSGGIESEPSGCFVAFPRI